MLNQYRDVFRSLKKHDVKYVVIGGIAAILHGVPRTTFDLDILIEASLENCQRLLKALLDARLGTASLITAERVLANEITIFKDRIRIDVQTRTPGISNFEEVWQRSRCLVRADYEIRLIERVDLISSKEAAGREVDLADVKALKAIDS